MVEESGLLGDETKMDKKVLSRLYSKRTGKFVGNCLFRIGMQVGPSRPYGEQSGGRRRGQNCPLGLSLTKGREKVGHYSKRYYGAYGNEVTCGRDTKTGIAIYLMVHNR